MNFIMKKKKISRGNLGTRGVLGGKEQYKDDSAYRTQAISQANSHQDKTDVALPDDENVMMARDWVDTTELS